MIVSFFLMATSNVLQLPALLQSNHPSFLYQEPEPTPMMGRFAIPEMPENPTQIEIGENLYFYHCMPCHGDHGQGLTDEFRAAWVDDHQNCWARGCHTGRPADEGFPIPKIVPPVIASQLLIHFPKAEKLYDYLSSEHPPQNPGILEVDEYWALTAFLWFENGQLPFGIELSPEKDDPTNAEGNAQPKAKIEPEEMPHSNIGTDRPSKIGLISLGIFLIGSSVLIFWIFRKRKTSN